MGHKKKLRIKKIQQMEQKFESLWLVHKKSVK